MGIIGSEMMWVSPKQRVANRIFGPQLTSKIGSCGAKFSHYHDLVELDKAKTTEKNDSRKRKRERGRESFEECVDHSSFI